MNWPLDESESDEQREAEIQKIRDRAKLMRYFAGIPEDDYSEDSQP